MLDDENHVIIEIGGMSCASCVSKIERSLFEVPGVKSVSVNLLTVSAGQPVMFVYSIISIPISESNNFFG